MGLASNTQGTKRINCHAGCSTEPQYHHLFTEAPNIKRINESSWNLVKLCQNKWQKTISVTLRRNIGILYRLEKVSQRIAAYIAQSRSE